MKRFGKDLIGKIGRGIKKPPSVIARRLLSELNAELDRWFAPKRANLRVEQLLNRTNAQSIDMLWSRLANRPFPVINCASKLVDFDAICPDARIKLLDLAQAVIERRIDLLGSGQLTLPTPIDWQKDYKIGFRWTPAYFRDIEYNNPERPSDVKMAWELSRLQWAIPLGQAWLLTGDERYPMAAKTLLDEWIDANPYAGSVNWSCTMEVALRIFTWTWFFHVFQNACSWSDEAFRIKFLTALLLHAEFTERHIESSDINGNHFTADAAGLVIAGLFFGEGKDAERWASIGWDELERELPLQVPADGVDFEASTAYHRLVLELFLLPARYRQVCGKSVTPFYATRLKAMARFVAVYSCPDGTCPLWGDADDARTLPFGTQALNDHRYLIGLVGLTFRDQELMELAEGSREEAFWWFGDIAKNLNQMANKRMTSTAFINAGVYVMRLGSDHVFIDCGPIGLAGKGGHGHNDCLSFEAVLDGVPLVTDCGAYLYTASYTERNAFRSTAYHNTPQVDGQEINRFIRPDYLWNLHYDAKPEVISWQIEQDLDIFTGSHQGYDRIKNSLRPVRSFVMDYKTHALTIIDDFIGDGEYVLRIPLHLAPGALVKERTQGMLEIKQNNRTFHLVWSSTSDWLLSIESARVSPSYGKVVPSACLVWTRALAHPMPLKVMLMPEEADAEAVAERVNMAQQKTEHNSL